MVKRAFCLALLASAAGAQQPQPLQPLGLPPRQPSQVMRANGPLIVPSRTVNIRLDPLIGDALAKRQSRTGRGQSSALRSSPRTHSDAQLATEYQSSGNHIRPAR